MNAPTPEKMRVLADQPHRYLSAADRIDWMEDAAAALRAAADEVDRSRVELAECDPPAAPAIEAMGDAIQEITRLHAVIENAPHDPSCWLVDPQSTWTKNERDCDCWKADAL